MFCNVVLGVSSLVIIFLRKREMVVVVVVVVVFNCVVTVFDLCLFLMAPWVGLLFVTVLFSAVSLNFVKSF